MRNVMWRGKRNLSRWQAQRTTEGHHSRLRSVRPVSCDFDWEPPTLNQNKKMMQQEDKYTEIERQNRYLLLKIATTMKKKSDWQGQKKMHSTLNNSFRKRQLQSIEVQNARLLKRIQEKKSDYDTKKLKQEWKKQKEVLKNIAFYPFVIKTNPRRRRLTSRHEVMENSRSSPYEKDIEMVRARIFNGQGFVVTIKMNGQKLRITGMRRKSREQKIIDIPRKQAQQFIQQQCQGRIEALFDKLSFDQQQNVLYLIGSGGEPGLVTIKEKRSQMQEQEQTKQQLGKIKEAVVNA